ncbi:MAG: 50S ribosomal protein L2, partial [Candidatus Paceibacterota bacterium]
LANEENHTHLKMSSGEVRKVRSDCWATIGQVSNPHHNLQNLSKAGRSRWKGRKPKVRGSAMNPVDHPYGGGEGKTQRGTRKPKTKWGKITGGVKTRKKNKRSNRLIIKRRKNKRRK